jgi:cytosine/adenosine deaminase-related metal-dependent hydrolase
MKTIRFYTQELKASEARLKVLTAQGAKALSRYDREIASGGDADLALCTAKRLVGNHIK